MELKNNKTTSTHNTGSSEYPSGIYWSEFSNQHKRIMSEKCSTLPIKAVKQLFTSTLPV